VVKSCIGKGMMTSRKIETAADYEAVARIDEIFFAEPNTPECDMFDKLTIFVEVSEAKVYPIEFLERSAATELSQS
jgi:HTH-type transcriptional regulator / antitoxin HigA